MPEENKNQNGSNNEKGEAEGGESITLSAQTYNAILDRLEELEAAAEKGGKEQKQEKQESYESYDKLVEGGREVKGQKQLSINDLSNEQFAELIEDQLSRNAITPLAVAIEGLKLDMEFMRTAKKSGFEDVEDVRDDILKVIQENPNMSVEKAYKLVRLDKPKSEKKEKESEARATVKLDLPKRVVAEKPGMPSSSVKNKGPVTIKDAAEETLDELGIKD